MEHCHSSDAHCCQTWLGPSPVGAGMHGRWGRGCHACNEQHAVQVCPCITYFGITASIMSHTSQNFLSTASNNCYYYSDLFHNVSVLTKAQMKYFLKRAHRCSGSAILKSLLNAIASEDSVRSVRPSIICRWVPVKERSRSLALVYSGMYSGSILGLALSPHMVEVLSWPSVFYIFGAVGIVWYILWQSQAASSPAADPAISAEERSYIEETSVLAVSARSFQ